MKKLLALLLSISVSTTAIADVGVSGDFQTISIENGLDRNERRVREAAVKITDGYGHGSGGIVQYYDMQLILTAQHVANGLIGSDYYVMNGSTMERAILVYSDPVHDIAVLWLREGNQLEGRGLRFSPTSEMSAIGTGITYSGHPSWHSLMTYRGYIAGLEHLDGRGPQLMIDTYGWFGCSGSVIYNTGGDIIGILWGVDVERRPDLQVQENMIWVSPIQNLDMSLAINELCIALEQEPRACRK
tara:strand:+ start:143 stop:874 length:732 start_codon:yes stop_codon:yes gene_type:complete